MTETIIFISLWIGGIMFVVCALAALCGIFAKVFLHIINY